MSTVINTNLASLFAQNSLSNAQNNLATSVQRLSSGLRINSAKDDAAGLAIAQNMQGQINGTNQSIQNLSDATNLLQTADSSLSTVQDMLLRLKQLATQGYDGSLSATQKADIVQQMQDLNTEINATAQRTSFNGINLLTSGSSLDTVNSDVVNGATLANQTVKVNSSTGLGAGSTLSDAGNTIYTISLANSLQSQIPGTYTLSARNDQLTLSGTFNGKTQSQTLTVQPSQGYDPTQSGVNNIVNNTLNFSNFGIQLNLTSSIAAGSTETGAQMASAIVAKSNTIVVDGQTGQISNVKLSGVNPGTYQMTFGNTGSVSSLGMPAGLASGQTSAGVAKNVALVGGSGSGATADISYDANGNISSIAVNGAGNGYKAGDVLSTNAITAGTVNAPAVVEAQGAGAQTETASVSFQALNAGETMTLGGLTFTAGTSGASAAQVAGAFENLQNGAITGSGTLVANGSGYYSGTFTGWTTSAASGNNVVFTSTTPNANVANLAPATQATSPVITTTQGQIGVTEKNTVTFADMKAGQTLTLGGLVYTAKNGGATAAQVAADWASLANTVTSGTAPTGVGIHGTWTANGAATSLGWDTGAVVNGNSVVFSGNPALGNVPDLTVATSGAPTIVTSQGGMGGSTETSAVTFTTLAAGSSLNLGGLIFTAGAAGATATQVAQAFQNLSNGATTGAGSSYGTYSGALSGWSTNSAAGGSSLTFTSATPTHNVTDLALATASTSVAISTAEGTGTSTEVATVDFANGGGAPTTTNALTAGQTITFAGLTFTASGNVTQENLAAAFSNLQNGVTGAQLNASGQSVYGSFTGQLSGWSTGSVSSFKNVAFTSSTANTNVTNLVATPSGTLASGPTKVDGIAPTSEQASVSFTDLKAGQSLTIAGLTFNATADTVSTDVALAFSNLANGTTAAAANTAASAVTTGSFAAGGIFTGWSTSSAGGGSTVSFNATSGETNVADLTSALGTGSATITSTTQGQVQRTESAIVKFNGLTAGQSISLAGVTYTAQTDLSATQVASKFISGAIGVGVGYSGTLTNWATAAAVSGANSDQVVFTSNPLTNQNVPDLTAGVAGAAPTIITTPGGATNSTESAQVTFGSAAMSAGDSVTIGGLTFTAGKDGVTQSQVAAAFSNLADGTSGANLLSSNGTFSGTLSGWSTGASNGTGVTFTSSTANTNVSDLTYSATPRQALNALNGIVVGGLANQTGSNLLTMSGMVNGALQTESITLKDNAAGASQTINFDTFGIQFELDSNQAQSAQDLGTALASLNTSSPNYGSAGAFKPGQVVVGQGANSALQFQSGAESAAFIQIDTLNIQTGNSGINAGSDKPMMDVGTTITGSGVGDLGGLTASDSISTWEAAFQNASAAIDNAVDYISTKRSTYGSQMNRLSYISTNLTAQSTNLENSRSAIIDTNFASETANLTKGQIMQQAATAMLAQANQMPNVILSLLK